MYRLVGASEWLRTLFRPWATDPAAVITAFGGATVLLFGLSILYWVDDRRKIATVVSYAFVALSVVIVLKTALGLPRPPAEVRAIHLSNDPYGFPSGHAVAAVVVYGGLATVYDRLEPRWIVAVGIAVAAIALSRVVLGVHYLGDVIVGTLLGLVLLAVLWYVVERRPMRAFGIATGCGLLALLIGAPEAPLALGGSLGGVAGSTALDRLPRDEPMANRLVVAVLGVVLVAGGTEAIDLASTTAGAVLGNALLVVLILGLPLASTWVPVMDATDVTS